MLLSDDTITFNSSIEAAWDRLIDWRTMHEWDIFIERLTFDGALAVGSVGTLKMKGGPSVALVVTSMTPPYAYTDEFKLFGSRFIFHHELSEQSGDGLIALRIRVEAEGLFASLLAPMLRQSFSRNMPVLMNNFKALATTVTGRRSDGGV